MKKLILMAACGLLALGVMANDLSVVYYDTITAADTAATAVDIDTVYTGTQDIRKYDYLSFYGKVTGFGSNGFSPMNFTGDTTRAKVQLSANRIEWRTMQTNVLLPDDSGWSALELIATDSLIFGNYLRGMFIHFDSTEATCVDSIGLLRSAKCELWVIGR